MQDVARRAGVSVATVSRALAGSPLVAPEVSERVRAAAIELNYVPSRLPRNLRSKASRLFGLVVGNVRNPYFPDLIRGCEEATQAAGYSLVIADTDEDVGRESSILEELAAERVTGVVLAAAGGLTTGLQQLMAVKTPIVAVDRRIEDVSVDTVTVDNEAASRGAVQHLIELGHRRIALIGGPQALSTMREREAGYRAALEQAGYEADPSLMVFGDLREGSAAALTLELLNRAEPPTAIFTVNNLATVGALRSLRTSGVSVPDQMSLIGFDDLPTGDLMSPPLTAIAQPAHELGRASVRLLIDRLAEPTAPFRDEVLATTFVVRASTAPLGGFADGYPHPQGPSSGTATATDSYPSSPSRDPAPAGPWVQQEEERNRIGDR